MDMFGLLHSSEFILNEQIARHIFDIIPDNGPIVVIIGKDRIWPSDSERFSKLEINESYLKEVCNKIDDGIEPVITQLNDCDIVASQLSTDHTNCGYVVIISAQSAQKISKATMDFIEIILNQTNLIAKLIEKNNRIYELQMSRINEHQN